MIKKPGHILLVLLMIVLITNMAVSSCNEGVEEEAQAEQTPRAQGSSELRVLNEQISANPNNPELYFNRARIHEGTGTYEAAINDLEKAISLDPSKGYYYVALSDLYLLGESRRLELPDSKKAVDILQGYLEQEPENTDVRMELAQTLTYISKYKESNEEIDRALRVKSYIPDAYYLKGVNLKYIGDTIRAINNFQNALEQNPDLYDAHMQLGLLFSTRNNKLALDYLRNAIRLDSAELEPYYAIALFHQNKEEYEDAIAMYKDIINRDPQNRKALYNLGFVYNELDTLDKAQRYFDMAVKVAPTYADAYYMRGLMAERQGKTKDALIDYQQALNIEPEHDLAQLGLERIKR